MSKEPPPQPPLGDYPLAKQSGMGTGAKVALGVIIGSCVVMGGCFACAGLIYENAKRNLNANSAVTSTGSPTAGSPGSPGSVSSSVADVPPQSAWSYIESTDEMTGQKMRAASVTSSNTVNFSFPYAGAQHAKLTIRRMRGSEGVILSIEKGQLTCGGYYGRSVSVRFDEKPPRKFNVTEPADHDSKMVFIRNEKSFIAEAKKAKRILIEAIVYQNGSPVFEFNTAGLEW